MQIEATEPRRFQDCLRQQQPIGDNDCDVCGMGLERGLL